MISTFAQLSGRLLSQQRYLELLEQRKWLQSLLQTFTLEAEKKAENRAVPPIVLPYGSVVSGTSFVDGDADYAVVFPYMDEKTRKCYSVNVEREKQETVLSDIFSHIRKSSSAVDLQPQRIFRARIPIVQYLQKRNEGDSKFDLSLSIDGVKNSLLLRLYMLGDPRLRLGVLCAKQWGREQLILNARRGWISPYALTIMYIYFMKTTGRTQLCVSEEDVVERVKAIVDVVAGSRGELEGIEEFASVSPSVDVDISTVQRDVYDFFSFYGDPSCFDFDVSVVDIRLHNRFTTKDEWYEAIKNLDEEDRWHLLGHENVLLRDPFEPHNLGRSVDFFRGEEIREKFRTSALKRDTLTFLSPT
ncbi:RNA polymerase II [Leptomonas seymouri]|uniref:RNA uridylyltransferase n=1 Tax=Leptomonas seymouri TaxID=5684 RepID=A0A0N1PA71_LEPSE|nr:RNA polymerase II [Leptomonas seymouri]|eukprot:KPI84775.1 RNA polymerase II [Leptomonas seymouri]